ncbi:MAG: TonB-dependent receptor [Bacteroidota bacterium]
MAKYLLTCVLLNLCLTVMAQKKFGAVSGRILDKQTGEGLPGATVLLKGTSIGEVTDQIGNFFIINAPLGKQLFEIRFLGYKTIEVELNIEAQTINELNVELELDATGLEEIVVTSQALGQAGAINKQLSSSSLVNVVSKDKIRELPDQNAAETVGRISGIYVQRDAGEGQKIVVRGLAPRFNNVTINGMRIPSTDPNDRSVDLSMVSPSMLEGIEVYKAARPDQDGDAIGGTVNFGLQKANADPDVQLNLQGGYNQQANELGQYKGDISANKRFLKDKLGVQFTANYQRANRSSDQLDGDWDFLGEDVFGDGIILPAELTLTDVVEIRKRYGVGTTLDYDFSKANSVAFNVFHSVTDRDEVRRRRRYRWEEARQEHDIRDRTISVGLTSASLSGNHILGKVEVSWQGSLARSKQDEPNTYESRFRELSAFNSTGVNLTGQTLDTLVDLAINNISETFLNAVSVEQNEINDQFITFLADAKLPYTLGSMSGFLKSGLKLRDNERSRQVNRFAGEYFSPLSDEIAFFINDFPTLYQRVPANGGIAISNFLTGFQADDFLSGDYYLGPGPGNTNGPGLNRELTTGLIRNMQQLNYLSKDYIADGNDYNTTERVYASYLMTELNVTKKLLLLAGVRFERTETEYTGKYMTSGIDADDGAAFEEVTVDSTGGRNYNEFLPMFHARYKATNWLDVRGSVTKTISRPDFTNLIPYRRINDNEQTINQANPQLLHAKSWNYDLSLSAYNQYALFTVSGFYKQLRDADYVRTFRQLLPVDDPFTGYVITSPDNSSGTTFIRGIELDLQANLRFLPQPFSNFILSANATFLDSETLYPFVDASERNPLPPFNPQINLDGFRPGTAQFQAAVISNISIGYEQGGFTSRLSMVYQGKTFTGLNTVAALDAYSIGNTRFDLALKQRIAKNLKIYFNWNNITNAAEGAYIGRSDRPTSEDYYGFTADLGIQLSFN